MGFEMKRLLLGIAFLTVGFVAANAQAATCDASGKQIVARRWDVVLGHEWELVRDCRHPEWPARGQATKDAGPTFASKPIAVAPSAEAQGPILVHAGDTVSLWQQAVLVRIEMSGVAERAARSGERVSVRVTHVTAEGSMSVERISGTVRAAGNVEIEP
jgi:hypothetical protein